MNDTLADLAQALDHEPYCLIVTEQRCFSPGLIMDDTNTKKRKYSDAGDSVGSTMSAGEKDLSKSTLMGRSKVVNLVSGIVTRIDLLDFISHHHEE